MRAARQAKTPRPAKTADREPVTGAGSSESPSSVPPRPLDGLRVIDLGTRIGAPFCAGLLGEWGADVIKVEQPGTGDFMRTIGPFAPTPAGGSADGGGDGSAANDGSVSQAAAGNHRLLAVLGRRRPGTAKRHLRSEDHRGSGPLPPACVDRRRRVRELPSRHPRGLGYRADTSSTRASSGCASAPSARTAPTASGPGSIGSASPTEVFSI